MSENKQGVINIHKEKGYTSHDVVAIIRKITRTKTGHTGTLDPGATGVLPVCLGRATKLADYFASEDKTYIAEIVPGITTDTGDISGEILTRREANASLEELRAAALSFLYENRGDYLQVPPMYSAVKIGGKKLYELARKGQTIERPPRAVKIFEIDVFDKSGRFFLKTTCSKGTYIRSLCADIGEALGCGAAMGELTRTRSGVFCIEDAHPLEAVRAAASSPDKLDEIIRPVEKLLPYPTAFIKPEGLQRALNGNPLPMELVERIEAPAPSVAKDGKLMFWVTLPQGRIIGLFSQKSGTLRAEVML